MFKEKYEGAKSCYILITCDCPNDDGKMQVQLSYEGDPDLASMMLEQAQEHLSEAIEEPTQIRKL